jgi:CBS domain-containing protein
MSLQQELTTDPLGRGYQQFIPDCPGTLADMLNAPIYTMPKQRFVNARGVLAQHGMSGAVILDKLEAAAATNSVVKWAMRFMAADGIDVGHSTTRTLLDALVGTVLTQAECDLLKDMAVQPASRAEVLGLGYVQEQNIYAALGL